MTNQPGLTTQNSPQDQQFFPFQENETIIGRTDSCAVQITWDTSVSRRHARIYQQAGLYWLEDLGSTNGTFLTLPLVEKRRLLKGDPALLLDGALIQFGNRVQMQVGGLSASQDEALAMVTSRLEQVLAELRAGMGQLPPEARDRQLEWLRNFENRLRSAQSQQEILMIASEGAQMLFGTVHVDAPPGDDLPPLPDDLPDPAANQVRSILNFFISDIRNRFPKEDDQNG